MKCRDMMRRVVFGLLLVPLMACSGVFGQETPSAGPGGLPGKTSINPPSNSSKPANANAGPGTARTAAPPVLGDLCVRASDQRADFAHTNAAVELPLDRLLHRRWLRLRYGSALKVQTDRRARQTLRIGDDYNPFRFYEGARKLVTKDRGRAYRRGDASEKPEWEALFEGDATVIGFCA